MSGQPQPFTLEDAAQYLARRYGPHLSALMAYGSRVCGRPRTGSAYDFWLILRDPDAFHRQNADFYRTQLNLPSTPEEQIALNREGPLFYCLRDGGLEMKLAVLGEDDLVRLCASDWWTVKGRMQKPLRAFRSTPKVDAAIAAARAEGLRHALNLVPRRFILERLLREIVGLSYRAEIRPERKRAKILSILESGREELARIYLPLLESVPHVRREDGGFVDLRGEAERRAARKATLRALRRSKWSGRSLQFIWRNFCSHRTPLKYLLLKVVGEIEKAVRRRPAR